MIILNIDYQRCREIVLLLKEYFQNQNNLAAIEYPVNITYGTNEYFIYMFYSCLLDYGMRS